MTQLLQSLQLIVRSSVWSGPAQPTTFAISLCREDGDTGFAQVALSSHSPVVPCRTGRARPASGRSDWTVLSMVLHAAMTHPFPRRSRRSIQSRTGAEPSDRNIALTAKPLLPSYIRSVRRIDTLAAPKALHAAAVQNSRTRPPACTGVTMPATWEIGDRPIPTHGNRGLKADPTARSTGRRVRTGRIRDNLGDDEAGGRSVPEFPRGRRTATTPGRVCPPNTR